MGKLDNCEIELAYFTQESDNVERLVSMRRIYTFQTCQKSHADQYIERIVRFEAAIIKKRRMVKGRRNAR